MNQFYYRPRFWIIITIFFMGVFFISCIKSLQLEKILGEGNSIYVTLLSSVIFMAAIYLGIFFTQRGKGKTEVQAVKEMGKSIFRISILWYLIGGIIIFVLFINLLRFIPLKELIKFLYPEQ